MTVTLRERDRWGWEGLFPAVRELRPMRLVLDTDTDTDTDGDGDGDHGAADLLQALADRPGIAVLKIGEDGPPPSAQRITLPMSGRAHPVGWIIVEPVPNAGFTTHSVTWATEDNVTHGGISGNGVDFAGRDLASRVYAHVEAEEAASRRRGDMVVLLAADATLADVLVTQRPYLLERRTRLAGGVTIASPRDALALVGLYLRQRGDFSVSAGPDGSGVSGLNKGLFYWVGARELLPAGWRWFSSCVLARDTVTAEALTGLGGMCLQRVARTLRTRDDVLVGLNQRPNHDQADDVAAGLDTCLVFLMGAVDAAARVAHLALGVQGPAFEAGWQRRSWLAQVKMASPQLADIVADGTPPWHALTILRSLRNSVHDEGMSTLMSGDSRRRQETLLELPGDAVAKLLNSMDALGGRERWGVRDVLQGTGKLYAEPGALLEQTLAHTVDLLNQLMERTLFELVTDNYVEGGLDAPPGEDESIFNPAIRRNVRLLLGL